MSSSKGSKRISVFDRLGPGNDEASHHRNSSTTLTMLLFVQSSSGQRRYSSEKHVGSSSTQDKGRGHNYSQTIPSPHVRGMDDTQSLRDRKSRWVRICACACAAISWSCIQASNVHGGIPAH